MIVTRLAIAVVAAASLGSSAAGARAFDFSYVAATGVISGRLIGTVQADGNTVFVDALKFATFNGVAGVDLPLLTTASGIYGVDRQAQVTFDASLLDFAACTDINCADGVIFDPDIIEFSPLVATGESYGNVREALDAGGWTLSAVPEPQTWALMIGGFLMVGAVRRRSRVLA